MTARFVRALLGVFLLVASSAALGGAPTAAAATFAPGGSTVIRDVEASRFTLVPPHPTSAHPEVIQPDTQVEPSIAVDPANPLHVVAGYQEGRVAPGGDMTNGFATSFDGGQTWTSGEIPCLTYTVHTDPRCPEGAPYDRASDAVVAFGPENTVYYNSLIFNDETGMALRSAISVNVSHDGGLTWSLPVVFQDDNIGGLNDKNWIVVDLKDGPGHHYGRVYAVWDRVAPVVYNYCDSGCDNLANWLPTMLPINGLQGIGAQPLVLQDGSLGVMYTTTTGSPLSLPGEQPEFSPGTTHIVFALAPAAGQTPFPSPLAFPQVNIPISSDHANAIRYQRASDGLPAAAVDPITGQIYVGWDDGRGRLDGVNGVAVTTSTDGGLLWSPVTLVPTLEAPYLNHYNVTIGVGRDSTVHVGYLQRQEGAVRPTFQDTIDQYHQESHDKGVTWTAPLKVSSAPSQFLYGAFSRNGLFQGDYDQLVVGGPYTYIVRTRAYAQTPNEPPGLVYDAAAPDVYDGDMSACQKDANGVFVGAPGCITHIHQRAWVTVLAAGTTTAVTPSPTATISGGDQGGGLPPTAAAPAVGTWLGLALVVAGLATIVGLLRRPARRRRQR